MKERNRLDPDHLFNDVFEQMDCGIFMPPCKAQKALDELRRYFLGEDWYSYDPVSQEQVNAEIVYTIEERYPGAWHNS